VDRLPPQDGGPAPGDLEALIELLAPGALGAGALQVLRLENFTRLLRAQGLVPASAAEPIEDWPSYDVAFRRVLEADLAVLAAAMRPGTSFGALPSELQASAVERGFGDPLRRPGLEVVRAACFLALFGAVTSDAGLVAIGYPPFEDFAGGVAVSGYPRTLTGRPIDPEREDLAALALANNLDDYTFNREPAPSGEDLSAVVDANGDLI
jgi:AcrR family transcriptional regulator